jgi:hypothetical protein
MSCRISVEKINYVMLNVIKTRSAKTSSETKTILIFLKATPLLFVTQVP